MEKFEDKIVPMFLEMPSYKVGNVMLRMLGRLIHRFDNRGQSSISKDELIDMIVEAVEYESNPRTTVDRLLERAEERKKTVDSNK